MSTRATGSDSGPPGPAPRPEASLAAPLRAVAGALRFWFGVGLGGALFLGWCSIAYLIRPLLSTSQGRRVGRKGLQRMFRCYLGMLRLFAIVEVDNSALIALRDERSLILAPNHPSMMDVLLVISQLDNVGCIMKAELWNNVFLGAGARLAGFIRNDSAHKMIRMAVGDLKRGGQLLIFPEATRTVRSPVNRLSGGYALIAKKANAPIQTILIETDSPYLRKGWPLFRRPPIPIRFRLRLGKRFLPRDDVDALVVDMERYYSEELGPGGREVPALSSALADSAPRVTETPP